MANLRPGVVDPTSEAKGSTRRAFIRRAGVTAVVVGSVSAGDALLHAKPAAADYTGTVDGYVHDEGGQVFNVKSGAWSAKGDTLRLQRAGSISSGTTNFTWAQGSFVSTDAGKIITVQGAGASGGVLSTTIASVQSASQITVGTAAATTVNSADFAFGTDDTAAILSAVSAAGTTGKIFAPPGTYMILGASNSGNPIALPGSGGLTGAGGTITPGGSSPPTVFLCGDSAAGLLANGGADYQGFCCDGNNIGSAPLQTGLITNGVAGGAGPYAVFIDVWTTRSAGSGWIVYGAQHASYYHCGSTDNALDGIYIDGGSQGLEFLHFEESGNARYGIHGDAVYPLGTTYGTSAVRFYSASLSSPAGGTAGVSKIYLRGATDWKFIQAHIAGDNLSGPAVDLDQSAGYSLDFSGCWISATPTGGNPGLSCIKVGGSPPGGSAPVNFLKTDRANFVAGDTSVYIGGAGSYVYSGIGWTGDSTTYGPAVASGLPGVDTLLSGHTGAWQNPSVQSPWSGTPSYRVGPDGSVEMSGSVTSSGGEGTIFALAPGYYDASGPTITVPAATTSSAVTVSIDSNGNVSASDPGRGNSLFVDGIAFPAN